MITTKEEKPISNKPKKLYRFMGMKEFSNLEAHIPMENSGAICHHSRTESNGFCFLEEHTKGTAYPADFPCEERNLYPEDFILFLNGIVSKEKIFVEFSVPETTEIFSAEAWYADVVYQGWSDEMLITEYYVKSYSSDTLIPTRYSVDDGETWYDF